MGDGTLRTWISPRVAILTRVLVYVAAPADGPHASLDQSAQAEAPIPAPATDESPEPSSRATGGDELPGPRIGFPPLG